MTHDEFVAVLYRRTDLTAKVLDAKAAEYAVGGDRLHNFRRAAALTRETPAEACWGFLAKHLVSIGDAVEAGALTMPQAWNDEKIGDAINYLILLEAIFSEKPRDG